MFKITEYIPHFIKILSYIESIATILGLLVISICLSIILTNLLHNAIILINKAWTYLWAYIFILKEKRIKK